jgi:hypothetical protein
VAPGILTDTHAAGDGRQRSLEAGQADRFHTLGRWGAAAGGTP